jgi:hypothetical protein
VVIARPCLTTVLARDVREIVERLRRLRRCVAIAVLLLKVRTFRSCGDWRASICSLGGVDPGAPGKLHRVW